MEVRSEIKSLIAKKATTLKDVCDALSAAKNISVSPNNIINKFRRKTIKFEEVQDLLDIIGYHIEFVENK